MAAGEELLSLIDREIPDGRKSLQESYMNLENVAKYCEDNYLKALKTNPNATAQALQDTKNYTTHSLASVAYQINNLATNFLKLLDLQQSQLTDMESSVNHLNQIVMIHKEKVARREIGVLTAGRNVPRPIGMKNGIIYPEQTERPIKYTRKSIDYTILDDVGHGVRQANTPRTARSPSVSSTHSNSSASNNNQAPTTKPPTPPVYRAGTIGRAAGAQQTRPVAPPMAPPQPIPSQGNFPPYPQSGRSSVSAGSSYSPSNTMVMGQLHSPSMGQSVPPGLAYNPSPNTLHNMTRSANPSLMHPEAKAATYARSNSNRGQSWIDTSTTSLPPPPPDDDFPEPFMGFEAQSPLPAPPSNEHFDYPAPPPQDFSDVREGPPSSRPGRLIGSEPEDTYAATQAMDDPYAATGPQLLSQQSWIPKHYLEKVVAIYDYSATKSDELSFAENAVIYVIHKNDDGWWEGVMDGQTGLFPYNYVEPCM
ncbi:abl interactor 2-like isoform X3 [Physella acuta]|uniref:abl interactor 2-like isoform X3 n=1 Tax=Physella acuta TaxID=109671 RepID=UPI0027DE0E20|nr:abl interactor 2-like isoform X3 [Physella acuta]